MNHPKMTAMVLISGLLIGASARAWPATTARENTAGAAKAASLNCMAMSELVDQSAGATRADARKNSAAAALRTQLIGKLKAAREQDDRNEQKMLNSYAG
jgi:hypothetical protein